MTKLHYNCTKYVTSATNLKQLPPDEGKEVAFAGRSNVGKSSAINTITNIRGLARTSKTPGRTQMINFFHVDEAGQRRFVDLPGYGYAKVPKKIKIQWEATLGEYLMNRKSLQGLILLMDIRHPMKDTDTLMIDWIMQRHLPIHILLTKADKLTRNHSNQALQKLRNEFKGANNVSLQAFSSLKRTGINEAHTKLNEWLD